ncbi:hypothetical protein D9M69_592460 [compost metagenome]
MVITIGGLVNARLKHRLLGARLPVPHMGDESLEAENLWQEARSKRPLLADFPHSRAIALVVNSCLRCNAPGTSTGLCWAESTRHTRRQHLMSK